MKKCAIVTIYGNNNYGNKLQNYAVQQILKKFGLEVTTIKNDIYYNKKSFYLLRYLKRKIEGLIEFKSLKIEREYYVKINKSLDRTENFLKFDELINKTKKYFNFLSIKKYLNYDYYFVGSDQVWNPKFGLSDFGYLNYIRKNQKKISFSASFGVDILNDEDNKKNIRNYLSKFKSISVREESGKKIIEDLTGRKDIEVLLDPTMLLDTNEWDKVSNKPKQIDILSFNDKKYILNYFLGNLNEERKKEIERIAKENDCKIINILEKEDPFYVCGPSEFIWLEKNAFLICTDSFHSSVFAILYKRPFIVFNRDDGQVGKNSMNSRLETLLSKFKLEDRYFKDRINSNLLECNYSHVDKILKEEKEKSKIFLKKALDINKEE